MTVVDSRWTKLACAWIVLGTASTLRAASGDVPVGRGEALAVKPPLPIWPSDHESIPDRQPVFRLNGRFQADRYRVEVARHPDFREATTLTDVRVADTSGITPIVLAAWDGEPLGDGQYYWRAFAGNETGFWTPAANYRTFFISSARRDPVVAGSEPVHPRLLLTRAEADRLRSRVKRSDHLGRGWRYQVSAALSALELEPPDEAYARGGAGQHGNYSSAASWYHRHLENIAVIGAATGDDRLLDKGVEMLMTACGYERWLGPLFDQPEHFDPPWHAALETAMMTEAVAIGYDLLWPHLTDEQRATVRRAIVEKGVRPLVHDWADPIGSSQLPRHQVPTGNWVMVCTSSAGLGALAVRGEHPEADEWVRLTANRVRAWLEDRGGDWYVDNPWPRNRPAPIPVIGPSEPNFGIDGGYKESISYMNYAMRYVCLFADALRRETGENLFAHVPAGVLDPLAWSTMAWPTEHGLKLQLVDFGDCGSGTGWYADTYAALTKNRADARAAWLYHRTVPVPTTPRALLWFDDRVVEQAPDTAVPMGVFRTIGQVVMRRGWSPDTPMAAIKFRQNRGHLDLGTFYLFGAGQPTIIDSGSTSYGGRIYREYASKSVAHNVVLVDDRPQKRADGELLAAVGTSDLTAASGELAAAYPEALRSWTRELVMMPGGVAIVVDQLAGRGAHRFDLVLHPEHPFELKEPAELRVGPASAPTVVNVYADRSLVAREQDGYHMTLPREYVRFDAAAPASRRSFVTVCRWPAGRDEAPTPLTVESTGAGQWRIDTAQGEPVWSVCVGGAEEPDLVTDARVAAVWKPVHRARGEHVLLLGGRRLVVRGRELLHATGPVNVAVEFDLPLRAHVWSPAPARLTLAGDEHVQQVFLDGEAAVAAVGHDSVALDIPAGECHIVATEYDRPLERLPALITDDLPVLTVPDAPAYRANVLTRSSSSWTDGLDAIDGNGNTAWVSLPGAAMPQWLEVRLPRAETMGRVEVMTGLPCAGRVEVPARGGAPPRVLGRFETTAVAPAATLTFEPMETDRLRVVVERIDPAASAARIHTLAWSHTSSQ